MADAVGGTDKGKEQAEYFGLQGASFCSDSEYWTTKIDLAAFLMGEYKFSMKRTMVIASRRDATRSICAWVFEKSGKLMAALEEFSKPERERTRVIRDFIDMQRSLRHMKTAMENVNAR